MSNKIEEEEEVKEEEELGEEIHEFKHTFVKEQMDKEKELFEDFIVRNSFFFFFVSFSSRNTRKKYDRTPRKEKRHCLKKRGD